MSDKTDTADVLVIGAGMSGGAFTWSLSEAGITGDVSRTGRLAHPKPVPFDAR